MIKKKSGDLECKITCWRKKEIAY